MFGKDFACGWFLEDLTVCDDLIHYHRLSPNKTEGCLYNNDSLNIDKSQKDSVDVPMDAYTNENFLPYFMQLEKVLKKYVERFPTCSESVSRWNIDRHVSLQYYPVGGGFKKWHCERGDYAKTGARHLTFMTYLNDVEDGGTEFVNQNFTMPAKKGLTVFFPTDWTYTHRGQVSETSEKYIITGWYSFVE